MLFFISSKNGTNKNYRYLSVLRLILSVPIRLTKGKTEQKQVIHTGILKTDLWPVQTDLEIFRPIYFASNVILSVR